MEPLNGLHRRAVLFVSGAGAVSLSLSACAGGPPGGPTPSERTTSSGSPSSSSAAVEWRKRDVVLYGHKVTVEVGPLVTIDEKQAILPVRVTRDSDDSIPGSLQMEGFWRGPDQTDGAASGTRLVCVPDRCVWRSTVEGRDRLSLERPGESLIVYPAFGAVAVDTVTVFLPSVGFFDVAVLPRADVEGRLDGADIRAALEYLSTQGEVRQDRVEPARLEGFAEALSGAADQRVSEEAVVVNLAGDVNFATDSAKLTEAAEATLKALAEQIKQYPDGGDLAITGHTDDVASEAYNQSLSDKRARAVADRLGQLTGLEGWKVAVSGKGEKEPRVRGNDSASRALNRRVEVIIKPASGTQRDKTRPVGGGDLPEAQGPVAKGPDGVSLAGSSGAEARVRLAQVRRSGGFLFGTLEVSVTKGDRERGEDMGLHWFAYPGLLFTNARGQSSGMYAADGLTLLANGQRIYPADYRVDTDGEAQYQPLTELRLARLRQGHQASVSVVWSDPGGDTVMLDHPPYEGRLRGMGRPFRLTDIPVVDGG